MSVQGPAGIQLPALSRPVSENPVDTTVERQRPAGAPDPADVEPTAPERRAQLEQAVEQVNKELELKNYDLKFEIVDKTRIIIRVVNRSTGEILRQIPPEDLLRGFRQLDAITGVRMDSKV